VNVVDQWFREALGAKMDGYFLDNQSLMYRLLRPGAVQSSSRNTVLEKETTTKYCILFSLVVFEEWMRSVQDN